MSKAPRCLSSAGTQSIVGEQKANSQARARGAALGKRVEDSSKIRMIVNRV